ncbi:MAG: PAS domain S-box protein [Candidatus Bathyarchaeia archaeon]|jgi:PAS domain S-box-containing protein
MKNTDTLIIKEQATGSGFNRISQLFDQIDMVASYNQIVFNNGQPVDYIILKINQAFVKLTGLEENKVLGRRFSEIIAQQREDMLSDRIGILANVALTGVPAETERFIKFFQKWFHIYVYSPEKGFFLELMQDITQRKRFEANLGLSMQIDKQLSNIENGLWILDSQGTTVFVNSKMANILGYRIDELVGKPFLNFLDEHAKAVAFEAGLPFKTFKSKQLELQFLHSCGAPVYTLVEASEVISELGEFNGLVLNITDISERKRVERALSKSQKKYSGLFQHLTDGFACCQVLFDKSGLPIDCVFLDVNEAFRRLTCVSDKPVLGRRISEVFSSLNQLFPDLQKIYEKVAVKDKTVILEKYVAKLGKWFMFQVYCPEKGYIAIILQDITQRKKVLSALKQSEKQYKNLSNSIADLFFALNASLKFTYWNMASHRYTGLNSKEVVGRQVYEVFGRTKTTRRAVKVFLDVMRTHRVQTFTDQLPKGDQNCVFEMRVYPTGNGISVFARDITERLKLQHALEQYAVHLEELVKTRTEKLKGVERLAAIGETAGMIGHDIRNPLQSIIGEVYLAKEELKLLPENLSKNSLTESINAIEEQTNYINKIVTDLQDYAKPLEPSFQQVDLETEIQEVISSLNVPETVNVSYFVEQPFEKLKTDASFIKRILTNLTLNGLQAMPNGGNLSIYAFLRASKVIIAVSDTGVGISEEVKEKIFKPLFTTKSKGQGFGLAVVKKLVEALNGYVSFETKPEKGTTFILEIPLWPN